MQPGVRSARALIETLRLKLLAPTLEDADESLAILTHAMSELSLAEQEILAGPPDGKEKREEMRRELEALRRDLRGIRKLVDNVAAFYQGWAKLLASMTAGYTATGDPEPLSAAGTVLVRG